MAEEMEEDPECTFHPKISEKSYHLVNKNRPGFVERNAIWLNQKEMKIKQLGENKEDKKLLHCTFQPQIVDLSINFVSMNTTHRYIHKFALKLTNIMVSTSSCKDNKLLGKKKLGK